MIGKRLLGAGVALAVLCTPAMTTAQTGDQTDGQAQRAERKLLSPGDPAPDLRLGEWVKGKPITSFQEGEIYVVEFWATWCKPCINMMPHLSELQHKHKKDGVNVLAVSIWERDRSKVAPKVEELGDKMDFRVVQDNQDGYMAQNWMRAAGRNGIPSTFVIGKDRTIAWIGHPARVDNVLKEVVAGTWDHEAYAEKMRRIDRAVSTLNEAQMVGTLDQITSAIDELARVDRDLAVNRSYGSFRVLVQNRGMHAEAQQLAGHLFDDLMRNAPGPLNAMSWVITTGDGFEDRDLDLAHRMAVRAVELTEEGDASILDTLARVHYERGEYEQAVAWQQKAVDVEDKDSDVYKIYADTLETYRDKAGKI